MATSALILFSISLTDVTDAARKFGQYPAIRAIAGYR
jgi:hypothetical protein